MLNPTLVSSGPFLGTFLFVLPAGDYYVGDPCYVLRKASYDRLMDLRWGDDGTGEASILLECSIPHAPTPARMASWFTRHGDGRYDMEPAEALEATSPGRGLAVDSGTLCVMDARLVEKKIDRTASGTIKLTQPATSFSIDSECNLLLSLSGRVLVWVSRPDREEP